MNIKNRHSQSFGIIEACLEKLLGWTGKVTQSTKYLSHKYEDHSPPLKKRYNGMHK